MNKTDPKALAHELANTLNDHDALAVYLSFTQKYKEEFLRKILNRVMSIPQDKIKRNRGALFTFLVKQHAGTQADYNWD